MGVGGPARHSSLACYRMSGKSYIRKMVNLIPEDQRWCDTHMMNSKGQRDEPSFEQLRRQRYLNSRDADVNPMFAVQLR
jgi:hypothetical protein